MRLSTDSNSVLDTNRYTMSRLKKKLIKYLYTQVHCIIIHNSQEVDRLQITTNEWINKMWYIKTVFQPFWNILGHSIYPKYLPRRNGNTCPQNDKNVKSSFIHNIQTLKTTSMSINRRLAIQTVVYSFTQCNTTWR